MFEESLYAQRTKNEIRSLLESPRIKKLLMATKNDDKPLIPLSIGDPTVFKNLKAPQVFVDAIAEAVKDFSNHAYFPASGSVVARKAIAEKHSYPENEITFEDVLISSGCSHALNLCFKALLNPREESTGKILIPNPGFPLYKSILMTYDLDFDVYDLQEDKNWEVDLNDLRLKASDPSVVAILVNNPSNPCGAVYRKNHLEEILNIAHETNTVIIADEIYGDITFGANRFVPMASLTQNNISVPIVSLSGIAKEFLAPGLRLGWMAFYDKDDRLAKVKSGAQKLCALMMGASSIVQAALPSILNDSEEILQFKHDTATMIGNNASYLAERLNSITNTEGEQVFSLSVPQGSMYAFVKINGLDTEDEAKAYSSPFEDTVHFFESLLQHEQLFVLPGAVFGSKGENRFRITLTPPHEILKSACDRMESFARRHM